MSQAANTVMSLILGLYHLIVAAIATAEHAVRAGLASVGIGGPVAELVMILVAILLVLAALQLFGRVFAVLIALFLIFALLQGLQLPA